MLILSALLCLCMLFASCQSGNEPQDESSDLETELPEEAIPENEKVEYDKIIAEWTKYLRYEPSETGDSVSAEKVFSVNNNADDVDEIGYGFIVRSNVSNGETVYDVFNVVTGKRVVEALYGDYEFSAVGCIIEVCKYGYDANTYDYYDSNGEKINGDPLLEPETIYADYENDTFSVLDRGYQVRNGRIVAIYDAGKEIAFPEYTEYKENKYVFGYDSIKVYDKNNKKLAEATIGGADSHDCYILSNGNLLLAENYELPKNATKYTYKEGDYKFDIIYRLIDIKSAEITEIPATFVIENMITPAQNDLELKLAFAGEENQFAMVRKIVDGQLEAVADYVILSDACEITAELPKIVKNQTGIYGALDDDTLVIRAVTGCDGEWLYSVDLSKGSVELYANLDRYTAIDGGFIYCEEDYDYFYDSYNYAIYNSEMEKLMDLPENCQLFEDENIGLIFVKDPDAEDMSWKLLVINDGQVSLKTMATEDLHIGEYYEVYDGKIFVVGGVWHNENGDFLLNENDYDYCQVVGVYSDSIVIKAYFDGVYTYYIVG